jgi:hypothetical protein
MMTKRTFVTMFVVAASSGMVPLRLGRSEVQTHIFANGTQIYSEYF